MRLKDKVALITGGGSGIGRAMATVFAKQGAYVFIIDRDEQGAAAVVAEIMSAGFNATYYNCNVADQQEVKIIIDSIAATEEALRETTASWPAVRCTRSYLEVLEDERVQGVVVATNSSEHHAIARAALRAERAELLAGARWRVRHRRPAGAAGAHQRRGARHGRGG